MSELEGPGAWLSGLDWRFPTAPGVLHGLCYTVIALHSVYKQILSLFLMGVKKKNRERGKKKFPGIKKRGKKVAMAIKE